MTMCSIAQAINLKPIDESPSFEGTEQLDRDPARSFRIGNWVEESKIVLLMRGINPTRPPLSISGQHLQLGKGE